MLPLSSHRKLLRRAVFVPLCLGLMLSLGPSWAATSDVPGPIHAGNTFGWYPTAWRDEFVGPLASHWHKHGRGVVRTKNGMLTLVTGRSGNLSTTLAMPGHATGRWEIRWKADTWGSGHPSYTVRTELIPAGTRKQYCGARNVALESFTFHHPRAKFYIRNLPDLAFRASRSTVGAPFGGDNWHTFAVEVTPNHISWFVDARVVRTERRSDALSGVPFTVRFSLRSVPGATMNPAKMQMDWLRYWTLAKPNDKSIDAPATVQGTYAGACPPAA
jgi:hypothetical protein